MSRVVICTVCLVVVWSCACSSGGNSEPAPGDVADGGGDASGNDATDSWPQDGAETSPDGDSDAPTSCEGVSCGEHGRCEVASGSATCVCNDGYVADGLSCFPALFVQPPPTGNDANDGSSNAPLATPQAAVDRAQPGTHIVVRSGTYEGHVDFPRSGEPDAPIVLQGEGGAILMGGWRVTGWQPAPEVADGVWKTTVNMEGTPIPDRPYNLTWNNQLVLKVSDENMQSGDGFSRLADPEDSPNWQGVDALYGRQESVTYLRFADKRNPNDGEIRVGPHWEYDSCATVRVIGQRHIVVRGLEIRGTTCGVTLRRGASDNVVENNTIVGGKHGVFIGNPYTTPQSASREQIEAEMCHRNKIRHNEITLDFIHDLTVQGRSAELAEWMWNQFKVFSDNDREGVLIASAGHDNEILENHIYQHWGGIQDAATDLTSVPEEAFNQRLKVYQNVVHDILDDGLEPSGGEMNAEWANNEVYDCGNNLRFKAVLAGPMYVYRNRFRNAPTGNDIFYMHDTTTRIYVYHNSFGGQIALQMPSSQVDPAYARDTWFVNNVFSNLSLFSAGESGDTWSPHFDYNLCADEYFDGNGWEESLPISWFGEHNIIQAEREWDPTTPSFELGASSQAREAGIDLSQPWELDGESHPALPGMTAEYYGGSRPDLGAVQAEP